MKVMRKIATLLLAICLVVPCFSMVSHAANRIMFEDPSTAVGQTLQLKGVIETDSAMEDREVVMTYDTSMLKFKSGDNVTETSAGELTYKATGAAGAQRVEFLMSFDVLKEGTTEVKVKSHTVYSTSDAKLTCQEGHSAITIAAGDGTVAVDEPATDEPASDTGAVVEVNGESYTLSENFTEDDIPEGFEESSLEYAGTDYKVVMQAETGLTLGYLVGAEEAKFFLYVAENATFAPFEQLEISETTVITLLSYVEDIIFPEPYRATSVEVNGISFPAWQNPEDTEVCVIYAMNNRGEKEFYQFDTVEGTYQRFEMPEVEEEKEADTIIAKLGEVLGENLNAVVLAIGFGFILLLIVVIILSVKLYNRNAELDELYDEFGIDLFDDDASEEKDNRVIKLDDEDDTFEDIEEETEDDIVIAELDEIDAASDEEDSEVEVEFYEQEKVEEVEAAEAVVETVADVEELEEVKAEEPEKLEDAMKALAAEVEADESYWDDDDDSEFEMDFIDLDD